MGTRQHRLLHRYILRQVVLHASRAEREGRGGRRADRHRAARTGRPQPAAAAQLPCAQRTSPRCRVSGVILVFFCSSSPRWPESGSIVVCTFKQLQ